MPKSNGHASPRCSQQLSLLIRESVYRPLAWEKSGLCADALVSLVDVGFVFFAEGERVKTEVFLSWTASRPASQAWQPANHILIIL